jgi:beta-glucanase (GH16 family)
MKNSRIFLVFFTVLSACLSLHGQQNCFHTVSDPLYEETEEYTWELVFQDDFDGTKVNESNWGMYYSPGHAGNGLRRPEAFTVADGILTVTAQMIDGKIVSGGMAHRLNQTYGKFEVCVRADDDPSLATSAVLLTWPQSERWPADGENDFYETTTNRRLSFHTFIHYGADNKQYHKEHKFDAREWAVVAMEWDPDWIKIYVNGILQWTLSDKNAIPDVPHHLCIQLDAFKTTMTGSPRMQVDWVKVYRRAPVGITSPKSIDSLPVRVSRSTDGHAVVHIEEGRQSKLKMEIYNMTGSLLYALCEKAATADSYDIPDLERGIHILKVSIDENSYALKF